MTEWRLDTHFLGKRVLVFPQLDSTSIHAAKLADDPAHAGTVVLTMEQTAGHGQHGRSWQCPAGSGILLSVLLFPPAELSRPAVLTAWATVSVCHTIERLAGAIGSIKWPNDVLVDGKKVAGILIEQGRGTVAGIGLNLNQSAESLDQAGLPDATSLALATGRQFAWDESARQLIHALDENFGRLLSGDIASLEAEWRRRLGLVGQLVEVESLDGMYQGRLLDCTFSGLRLETGGGVETILPEKVRHVVPRSLPVLLFDAQRAQLEEPRTM